MQTKIARNQFRAESHDGKAVITAAPVWAYANDCDAGTILWLPIPSVWADAEAALRAEIAAQPVPTTATDPALAAAIASVVTITGYRKIAAFATTDIVHPGPWHIAGCTCRICGAPFIAHGDHRGPAPTICSDACHAESRRRLRPAEYAKRRAQRATRGEARAIEKACAECGEIFTPARADAQFCSPRCRTAHHRRHHRAAVDE